jgi:pimeloyl-ACP methyl ester carboxylesterase
MGAVMDTRLLSFEDVDLAVLEQGNGPPMVFIHGYTCTHDLWRESLAAFSGSHRCVAYDLRGHGRSSTPATGYGIQDHTADLVRVMDALNIPLACLVGFAMGGGIALSAALNHPGRVSRLVLASSTLGGLPWEESMWNYFREFENQARQIGVQVAVDRVWVKGPLFTTVRRYPALTARLRRMAEQFSGGNIFDRATYPRPTVHDSARLGEIACPTLVVRGDLDPPEFVRRSSLLHEGIQNSRLEIIPAAGHFCLLESPVQFNRVIERFLKET